MHQLYVILYLIKEESKYFFNSKTVTQMNIFSVFNNNKIDSLRISRNYIPNDKQYRYRYILKSEQCNGKGTLCLPFLLYWNFLFIIIIILSFKRMILKKYIEVYRSKNMICFIFRGKLLWCSEFFESCDYASIS